MTSSSLFLRRSDALYPVTIDASRLHPGLTWVLFACFVLFPFKRATELPLLILVVAGATLGWKHRHMLYRAPSVRFFSALFACIWLPIVASSVDSYGPSKSIGTALSFVRLYLAGLCIIWTLSEVRQVGLLAKLLAALAAIWVVDALVQAFVGTNLLGFSPAGTRINGFFGETNPKLGNALPVIAPFLLLALRRNLTLALAAAVLTGAVVFLAGSRGGWISYGVVCTGVIVWVVRRHGVPFWKCAAVTLLALAVGAFAVLQSSPARQRLDQTLLLFSGDESKIDEALSMRWTLWQAAFAMIEAHPVNGVGARAFRYAYPEFSKPDDSFVSQDPASSQETGAFYAHQLAVEVTTETGLIGLAGLCAFYWLFIRHWHRATPEFRVRALPFALGTLAWIFPLNTHPAFYSAQWATMLWLMIAMCCAVLLPIRPHAQA